MNALWYNSLLKTPYIKKQCELIDIWHSMDDLQQKTEKYRKWLRKGPLEKDLAFFLLNYNFKILF